MAFSLTLSQLPIETRQQLIKNLTFKTPPTPYDPNPSIKSCYVVNREEDELLLPLGLWKYNLKLPGFPREKDNFLKMNNNITLIKQPLTKETDPLKRGRDQDVIIKDALNKLEEFGSVFLALFTGMGKSFCSIYLSLTLKLKTIVLCHLDIVKQQWVEEYINFTNNTVKVQYLKGNCKLDPEADVYIAGIKKATSFNNNDLLNIGTVIIDESHIATVTAFTQTLLKFKPRYLIGLSATPDRSDGLHQLFTPYFGLPENFIVRKEKKEFVVYRLKTKFEPTITYVNRQGKITIDWNIVINSIESIPERWQLIVNIILKHKEEKILVLCNRKMLAEGIYNLLIKEENAELLIGNKKVWNKEARVTVAGMKKAGVGFNDPKLTMAIIASDTQDIRQYEGRIRTTNNIIYHLNDNYKQFDKHYKECEKFYKEKGATIKYIDHI